MISITELFVALSVTLISSAVLVSAVLRLRKKLHSDAKPTLGTYINEVGGYLLVGLCLLICGIGPVIAKFLGVSFGSSNN